jgi:1,2-diacylglycerol 3-beta-galactosyltransferase
VHGPASALILFSDTGGGHRAAAKALDGALRRLEPDVRVTWCDPLIGQGKAIARRVGSLYPTIIKRSPRTWGAIFHASNNPASFVAIKAALRAQLRPVLERQIAVADPDVVISVHPLLNHVTASLLSRGRRSRALVTVVTDLVDVHRGWACRRADLVIVATEAARAAALRRRLRPDRVLNLGLPVDLAFRPAEAGEKQALRRRLGLDEERPTALLVGGGEGTGGLLTQAQVLAADTNPWQVIVICGRNQALRRRLLSCSFETPTLVLGFVDDMPELMRASDLVVGKGGPGAVAEAIASGLPIVITSFLPGQERGNVRYVREAGAGRYAPRPRRLLTAVTDLLGGDGSVQRDMAARARALSRPQATLQIAAACLRIARAYRADAQASR